MIMIGHKKHDMKYFCCLRNNDGDGNGKMEFQWLSDSCEVVQSRPKEETNQNLGRQFVKFDGHTYPKSHHSIVREIQTLLLSHKYIHLRWLKAHVGYLGNECADQLAKEAITKGDPCLLPKPLSHLKSEIRSAAFSIRQDNWDNGETGRSTHDRGLKQASRME
ncbi:hypothetical protein AVEN_54955-1 [Araneus ventricosus]|uniref:Uncharacterized protein n=1 Tax=Araneus ventricosus TaxID=182803 RepID=A0A4Y2LJV5_ARAVE|nr:hypothetical protein AVEN_54955-1 [Araneus ventricosus]